MLFNCGNCGLTQEVSEKFANKTVKCPKCKASVTIGAGIPQDNHRYSISEFIKRTSQKDKGQGKFELESDYLLEVNLKDLVWTKMGSMIAYRGKRAGLFLCFSKKAAKVIDFCNFHELLKRTYF